MGELWVVACSRCRQAKVCAAGQKTTTCGHCSRSLQLGLLKKHYEGEDAATAAHVAGKLNAKLAGQLDAFLSEAVPQAPPKKLGDKPTQVKRVALDLALGGPFAVPDFEAALKKAGLDGDAGEQLARLVAAGVLYEPRRGRFAAL